MENKIDVNQIKRKDRKFYFGFGPALDYPEWQNGLETSLTPELIKYSEYRTNPFAPRLRRILKDFKKNIEIQSTFHNVTVNKGEEIRPVIYGIARKLISAGWILGNFNRNMAVDDIWEECQNERQQRDS